MSMLPKLDLTKKQEIDFLNRLKQARKTSEKLKKESMNLNIEFRVTNFCDCPCCRRY